MKVNFYYRDHGVAKKAVMDNPEKVQKVKRKLVALQKSTQHISVIGFAGAMAPGMEILNAVAEVTA
jgi:hypothetical protein